MTDTTRTPARPPRTAAALCEIVGAAPAPQPVERALAARTEQVTRLAARTGLSFPLLGAAPLFDGLRLVTRTTPAWVLYNLEHDPLWRQGAFPVPLAQLRRLEALYRAGVEFDALYAAHELPDGFRPGRDRLELEVVAPGPPPAAARLSRRLGALADGTLRLYAAALGRPVRALAVRGAAGLAALRDPVLMGAVLPPGAEPAPGITATWFLLAAWRW